MLGRVFLDTAAKEAMTMPSARPGVLFVGNFLSGAGLNRSYCEDLTDRLEQRGWPVLRTSRYRARAARLADMLATAVSARGHYLVAHVDLYSGAAFAWAEAVCTVLRALRKPIILSLHGGNLPSFAERWPRRIRRLLAQATTVTAPSGFLRARLARYRSTIEVHPNGLDASSFAFVARSRLRPRLVWIRAFHEIYNPVLAVEVVARLRPHVPGVHLTMIGPDKRDGSREAVERRISELGLGDAVTMLGRVSAAEVKRHLADNDIFLNTTNVDNAPLSLLEAMATGLCVVTTEVGGIPFLVRDAHEALLAPANNAEMLAQRVAALLQDDTLAATLSRGGREAALAHDWPHVLDGWETTFEKLAA